MKKLLAIEWLKLKDYNVFKLLSIFFIIGVVLTNYIVFLINRNIIKEAGPAGAMLAYDPYSFTNTWQTTSYATGFLLILPALLIIILVTNEFSFRTSRQNIIDGWNRNSFINVKLVMALIAAVATTVLVLLTALVFGLFSGTEFSTNKFSYIGFFFLKAVTYNMIAVLISVLVRKTGFAIGLYFIYMGAENIISKLLDVWSIKLKKDGVGDFGNMGDYLPMNASDGLMAFPDNPIKSMAQMVMPSDKTEIVMVLAFIYLFLFIYFSNRRFVKTDL